MEDVPTTWSGSGEGGGRGGAGDRDSQVVESLGQ